MAVYLKSIVLMVPDWDTPLGRNMHPPIDRTLLQNLSSCPRVISPFKMSWRSVNWTTLTDTEYHRLIEQLRLVLPSRTVWKLEQYWDPVKSTMSGPN